jgi:hypothetical protein
LADDQWVQTRGLGSFDNNIGERADLLIDHNGKNTAAIIGVGGFLPSAKSMSRFRLAMGFKKKDNSWYPIINTDKGHAQKCAGIPL